MKTTGNNLSSIFTQSLKINLEADRESDAMDESDSDGRDKAKRDMLGELEACNHLLSLVDHDLVSMNDKEHLVSKLKDDSK